MKKFFNGIFPSILITLPIGSVYAFSLFSSDIANLIGCSFKEIQFAFSLSIFFLGMGAAFGGTLVEKNITKSAILSSFIFSLGLILTSLGISLHNIWFIYVGYGFFCGIAQGIGYLTPVKTLVLWFPKNKGVASAISIVSFGLGSSLCTLLHKYLYPIYGIENIFYIFAIIYFVMMIIGGILIKKPNNEQITLSKTNINNNFKYKELFKDKFFICAWLYMFLNISAGLSLIGSSVNIFKNFEVPSNVIAIMMMLAGIFNGSFRLFFAWISDLINGKRIYVWGIIAIFSCVMMFLSCLSPYILIGSILIINATYGGGFSTLPTILSEHYDLNRLSRIHGATLSAWGIAGLIGNNITTTLYSITNSFSLLPYILLIIYILNIIIFGYMITIVKKNFST